MKQKQFKTESKKMLDMMINSIYTHNEIFLRELISNASDAIDKRAFKALTDTALLPKDGYEILIKADKDAKTITITDNGCGMTEEELENNLGTIAKSGSGELKAQDDKNASTLIGQFGVGFYSAFMVSSKVIVKSHSINDDTAHMWESEGSEGYTITECEYAPYGSEITLFLKNDTENEKYSKYLEDYEIRSLVKKYSDYIRHPIKMGEETFNSMVPIWHKNPKDVKKEEYNSFYSDKFFDYEEPAKVIHYKTDGLVSFDALLFIPKHPSYDYYTKDYKKGLMLFSNGVMIEEKCEDSLPDYFAFVKGIVDSSDFTLNISRETLQHDHQLQAIAKNIEKKIKSELEKMLANEKSEYEKFFDAFGIQLKYGIYQDFGMHKDTLQDLLMFKSSKEKKYVTLKEYVDSMREGQDKIYYAPGESIDACAMLPQVSTVSAKGYEVLFLTDDVDEFAIKILQSYNDKKFVNVCTEELDISTAEEKEALKTKNDSEKEMLEFLKNALGDNVATVKFTNTLGDFPVCLTTEGELSAEMEKVLNKMPGSENGSMKAKLCLEINMEHKIAETLKNTYTSDKEKCTSLVKVLYNQARLINGLPIENPSEYTKLVCDML